MTSQPNATRLGGDGSDPAINAVAPGGHEEIIVHHDRVTGLRAIVAIHSTARGAALGGTRFRQYASDGEALADVLALSRAMSYKNALAGLDHGGGKAVIIGEPSTTRSRELLLAYGRLIDSLGGRYVTAGDVGTTVADLDVMSEESRWVTGKSPDRGGGGDSGRLTAWGVFQGMLAAAEDVWGEPSLAGRSVAVTGLGKVGGRLAAHLLDAGAEVCAFDQTPAAAEAVRREHPALEVVDSLEALLDREFDVFSPNALGGAVDAGVASTVNAKIICGAANNQLADPALAHVLAERGILYMPDYLVNAGGVIQVADELHGYDDARAEARATAIGATARSVLQRAREHEITPAEAADALAEERIQAGPWTDRLFPGLADARPPPH